MQGSSFTDWFSLSHNTLSTDDWLIFFFRNQGDDKNTWCSFVFSKLALEELNLVLNLVSQPSCTSFLKHNRLLRFGIPNIIGFHAGLFCLTIHQAFSAESQKLGSLLHPAQRASFVLITQHFT